MLRIVTCYVPGQFRGEAGMALGSARSEHPSELEVLVTTLPPNDDRAYGMELAWNWRMANLGGFALAIVEPDIVVRRDVIDAFLRDPSPYLCFPYVWGTNVGPALGCTRFSAAFIARYPNLLDEAVATGVGWRQLDIVIMRHLLARKYGEQPKVCLPPVEHLNEAKALEPGADPTPMMSVPTNDIGNLA